MGSAVPEVNIILCIPGPWADRSELVERVVRDSGGYLFAGMVLMHMETSTFFELDFCDRDERMLDAFQAAGFHWRGRPEMDVIADHRSVVYLIAKGGSLEAAHRMMEAANGLLKAGGLGVKVETSGVAHAPADWAEQCQYNYLFKSHTSYVVYVASDEVYSCGMHNFGLPDALVSAVESDNPAELLRVFTLYLLSESPEIKPGQTFSADEDAPRYRIESHPGVFYGEDSLFNNPYGTWKLVLIEERKAEPISKGRLAKLKSWITRH